MKETVQDSRYENLVRLLDKMGDRLATEFRRNFNIGWNLGNFITSQHLENFSIVGLRNFSALRNLEIFYHMLKLRKFHEKSQLRRFSVRLGGNILLLDLENF